MEPDYDIVAAEPSLYPGIADDLNVISEERIEEMATSDETQERTSQSLEVPQDGLVKILLMFVWPAA